MSQAIQAALALSIIGIVTTWAGWGALRDWFSRDGPGIRTPATLVSDVAWRAAQRSGGGGMLATGIVLLAAAGGVLVVPSAWRVGFLVGVAAISLGLSVISVARGSRAAKQAHREASEGGQPSGCERS